MTRSSDGKDDHLDPDGTLPANLARGLRELPRGSRIRVVEASSQRLVLYVPSGGRMGQALLYTALLFLVLAVLGSVWAAGQIQQGVPPDRFLKIGIMIWAAVVFLACLAIKASFERTFLMLARDRIVVQRVLLGYTRKAITELAGNSRAELIEPGKHGASLDGVQVPGKSGIAKFGNINSTAENGWLVERINEFLAANWAAVPATSERPETATAPLSAPQGSAAHRPERGVAPANVLSHHEIITPESPFAAGRVPHTALATGPFRPPVDYVFEAKLEHPTPRPVSAGTPSAINAVAEQLSWFFLVLGAMAVGLSTVVRSQNWVLSIVSPTQLSWIGYALLAVWGVIGLILAYSHIAPSRGCEHTRRGQPVVARVLGLANTPSMILNGFSISNYIVALIEFLDPDTSVLRRAEAKSQPFPAFERANYTTSFRVGDYVTAIFLPGERTTSLTLFSFLGHAPRVGLIRRIEYPRILTTMLLCLLIISPLALLEGIAFINHFYQPMDLGNWDDFKLFVYGFFFALGTLFVGLIVGERWTFYRATRRNVQAITNGEPFDVILDDDERVGRGRAFAIVLGSMFGGLIGISAGYGLNAWCDNSPARIQRLQIVRLESGSQDRAYHGYSIVYREGQFLNAHRHGVAPRDIEAWQQAGVTALDAEIHQGHFGWRWIQSLTPVAAAPPAPGNQRRLPR
jgi:hypothetical protein